MRVRWRSFELPNRVVYDEESLTATKGKFIAEPFERGYGTTIGNSLRRILISSIEGAAVTKFKIDSAQHEYTAIDGVIEDVTLIALNVKDILVKLNTREEVQMTLKADKKGEVTAGDITPDSRFEIANPDHVICTLAKDVEFHMTLWAQKGRGYSAAEELNDKPEIGIIPVDATFSPITRANFSKEDARVGKRTDYDRLIMEIETDGTIDPKMALVEAAKILRKHLNPFLQYDNLGEPLHAKKDVDFGEDEEEEELMAEEELESSEPDEGLLTEEVTELDLGNRPLNGLMNASINTIGKLVEMTEEELKNVPKLGDKSVAQIKEALEKKGLSLKED